MQLCVELKGFYNKKINQLKINFLKFPIFFKRDFLSILDDPMPGVFVMPDDADLTILNALIVGPADTPYEGGFFQLILRFPPNYPFDPPKIKNLTTSGGTVRFNPNFYKNGKICLSIIGTWPGPGWLPTQTISSVLISIQSLLNSKPYHNEPGFEKVSIKLI